MVIVVLVRHIVIVVLVRHVVIIIMECHIIVSSSCDIYLFKGDSNEQSISDKR